MTYSLHSTQLTALIARLFFGFARGGVLDFDADETRVAPQTGACFFHLALLSWPTEPKVLQAFHITKIRVT